MLSSEIRLLGDPVLRQRSQEVTVFDTSLSRLVSQLQTSMLDANGAGLAAPQLGVSLRVFTFRRPMDDPESPGASDYLVNPVLSVHDATPEQGLEGCLSIPGFVAELPRPYKVVASGLDLDGGPKEIVGTSRLARCLLHETDHLDGVLFIDHLSQREQRRAWKILQERGESVRLAHSPHQ